MRFADYFVDGIIIGILQRIGARFVSFFWLRNLLEPNGYDDIRENTTLYAFYSVLLSYFISSIYLLVYYTFLEGSTKGRTLGKLVTGTQAVTLQGGAITWKDALLRSLCRIIPFEVFSGFGTPWHDSLTKTQVAKIRK